MSDFAKRGFYPFWFWNGDMSPDEIGYQIDAMAAQGVRGFFVHPRQGLGVPYLSDAFFDRVRLAADQAARHGMSCELYDEFPYPSGPAGGQATVGRPEYQATALRRHRQVLSGGGPVQATLPAGHLLQVQAFPTDAAGTATDWSAPRDLMSATGICFSRGSYLETGLTRYNNKRYLAQDPVPTVATELPAGHWLLLAVYQVRVDGHKYFGNFLDVMNPDAVAEFLRLTHGRYARELGPRIGAVTHSIFVDETCPHWSSRIPAEFEQRRGEPIAGYLVPFLVPEHPDHVAAVAAVHGVQYAVFLETWEGPYRDACHAAGLLYAGEKPAWRLSQLAYMDIPGADPGHTKAGAWPDCFRSTLRSNARGIASAAYFYAKPASLVECYHSLGWTATLQDAKLIADLLLLGGIDMLVPHGFFFSSHALRKHDAPPSFFLQMPYWGFFGQLSAHVAAVDAAFAGTHIAAEVVMIEPSFGVCTQAQTQDYEAMMWALLGGHCDFMHVDTDILERARLEADGTEPILCLKDLRVRAIALPPMRYVEAPLRAWLARWREAGGRVLESAADCHAYAAAWNRDHARPALVPVGAREASTPPLISVRRRDAAGRTVAFLVNPAAIAQQVAADGVTLTLAPFESRILQPASAPISAPPLPTATLDLAAARVAAVTPSDPNPLRLNTWRLALADADWRRGPEADVPCIPAANQLAIAGLSFTPQIRHDFGVTSRLEWPQLRLSYRTELDLATAPPADARLLLEPDGIVGDWTLYLNGHEILPARFAAQDWPVRGTLAVPVAEYLARGRNALEVRVATNRPDGGLLNPLYLAVGAHRVRLRPGQPPAIEAPTTDGAFEAYLENGLPHYVGVLHYTLQTLIAAAPVSGPLRLRVTGSQEALRLRINGGAWHSLLWEPRDLLIDGAALAADGDSVEVELYSTLGRYFDALEWDSSAMAVRDVAAPTQPSN